MRAFVFLLLVSLACSARVHIETSAPRVVPAEYRQVATLQDTDVLHLGFAIKHRNVQLLEQMYEDRTNPKSPNWRKWLSIDELAQKFAPLPATFGTVVSALRRAGALNVTSTRLGLVSAYFTHRDARNLLQTNFAKFLNTKTGGFYVRSVDGVYTLPVELAKDIEWVHGARHLPQVRTHASVKKGGVKKNLFGLFVTPKLIRTRYGFDGVSPSAANNTNGVAQFIGQHYSQGDLDEFFNLFASEHKGQKPTVVGNNSPPPGVEASLDIQYMMGLASLGNGPRTYFWVTKRTDEHPFFDFFSELAQLKQVPYLFSVSYGESEAGNTADQLTRLEREFKLVGLRGVTITFASGDSGVAASQCQNGRFDPDWPATSSVVTSVGGSKLGLFETGRERAWSGSGGGFSNFFARPSFQQTAVANYISKYSKSLPPQSYWNQTGRAYPDVASFSTGFLVVIDRIPNPVDGTSCASPTFASVISLLNDVELQRGRPSLGPLNTWLYQTASQGLTDITDGENQGCLGQSGFSCAPGWDPVTGLGSPLYSKLKTYLP